MALLHLASRGLLARSTRVEPDSSQTSRLLDTQACEIIDSSIDKSALASYYNRSKGHLDLYFKKLHVNHHQTSLGVGGGRGVDLKILVGRDTSPDSQNP